MQSFEHDKSNSISHLIKSKSRYLQKLSRNFNETKTSVSKSSLLAGILSIVFALHSKDLVISYLVLFNLRLATISLASKLNSSLKWFHKFPNVIE